MKKAERVIRRGAAVILLAFGAVAIIANLLRLVIMSQDIWSNILRCVASALLFTLAIIILIRDYTE